MLEQFRLRLSNGRSLQTKCNFYTDLTDRERMEYDRRDEKSKIHFLYNHVKTR